MQWLIDLIAEKVIATIGIPPTYIDRGDPAIFDFLKTDLTQDGAWHELDLSAIVPAGAVAVNVHLTIEHVDVHRAAFLRKHGNANNFGIVGQRTQVSNKTIEKDGCVAISSDRKIDYFFEAPAWLIITMTITGWWL